MTITRVALALVVALTIGPAAEARVRGAGSERVHSKTTLATAGSVRVARLAVERRSLQNQSIRLDVSGAPSRETLTVLVADATGALVPVGTMRTRGNSRRASWFVRTARGDALPFGVSDVAFLSGRAIEVRSAAGDVLVTGVMPTATKATGIARKMKTLKQGLAVDPALAGVSARIVFRRGEHGRADRLAIRVDGAAPALALEAWLVGTDGTAVKLGDLAENANGGDDGEEADDDDATGSDDGASGDDYDYKSGSSDDDDGDAAKSEYEFDLDATDALPFGAASLADLAGLALEIRNAAAGSVVAAGTVPDTSAPGDESDDGDDETGDDSSGGDGLDD